MEEPWNRTLWAGVAILCYLTGVLAFLAVIVGAGVIGTGPGMGSLTAADYATLLASVSLFVAGGYAMQRVRRPIHPDQSPLPSQFRRGPGPSRLDPEQVRKTTVEPTRADVVRCPDCGAENDAGFTYCGNCSSELPR